VLLFERRSNDDEILKLNPASVIVKIFFIQVHLLPCYLLILQGLFYLLYLYVCFAIDLASFQRFRATQVFTSLEFTFLSTRGLITALSLAVAMAALAVPLAALVPTYKQVPTFSCQR
jgi:hypothetical protein